MLDGFVRLDGLDDRLQFGEFTRQSHVGVAIRAAGEVRLDGAEAAHQCIERHGPDSTWVLKSFLFYMGCGSGAALSPLADFFNTPVENKPT